MKKERIYGVPASLNPEIDSLGRFHIPIQEKINSKLEECVQSIVTSSFEAKKFLENPKSYLNSKGITNSNLNVNEFIFKKVTLIADEAVSSAVHERNAKNFVDIMVDKGLIPQSFVKSQTESTKPKAAWAIVAVSPAVVYTTLAAYGTVAAWVAAYAWVGVGGPKFQNTGWLSMKLDESMSQPLSMSLLLGDEDFAKEVDKEIMYRVEKEIKEFISKYKKLSPINSFKSIESCIQ
ncbi:hypothetical protein BAMA_10510 [Bacillus manliponensis]|uniref:Uncharacterized protein n=1 Tax=Bacillus manliponensis TaxID=574376 RepID=A0A073JUQ8_9BACI|nr:hypothetical protein [Bacillus manliponensis]KEK17906.1 hypothetical protein BAMA_10510 [Bacillus manliponensis]